MVNDINHQTVKASLGIQILSHGYSRHFPWVTQVRNAVTMKLFIVNFS
jgi:hypothetical protein